MDQSFQGNWTWTPWPSWLQDDVFTPSWQAWALMELHQGLLPGTPCWVYTLHCIHWILQQNLRVQSQSPEQKLCHKARWFYGIVFTSRPFTYREPSITARSSGASLLNRIVEIYVPVSSSWYLEPNETWHIILVGFQLCLNWFGTINKHSHQRLSKVSDSPKIGMSVHMVLGQHMCVCM